MKGRADKMPGLPREALFGHLAKVPSGRLERRDFEQHVWWWRRPEEREELYISNERDQWPNCQWFHCLQRSLPSDQLQSLTWPAAESILRDNLSRARDADGGANTWGQYWDNEAPTAFMYEWVSRAEGRYEFGVPYHRLSFSQREQLKGRKGYWKPNMASVPVIVPEEGAELLSNALERKWVDENSSVLIACLTQPFRVNLALHSRVIQAELRKFIKQERARLDCPPPPSINTGTRRDDIRFLAIEAVDVKTQVYGSMTGEERTALHRARKRYAAFS